MPAILNNPRQEFFPPLCSGDLYDNCFFVETTSATLQLNANNLDAWYFWLQRTTTFSTIECELTGAVIGGLGQIGLYNAEQNTFYPTSLIYAGEFSTTTLGVISLNLNITLSAGMYALVSTTNAAAAQFRTNNTTRTTMRGYPAWGVTNKVRGLQIAAAYAPLPDPFPAGAANSNRNCPIRLKVA